jgi:hypothetical protein
MDLKIKLPKMRQPEPTKKELAAWKAFIEFAREFPGNGRLSPMVAQELERLVRKGNPLAARFKDSASKAGYRPRCPEEAPAMPPAPRRIENVRWSQKSNVDMALEPLCEGRKHDGANG